MGTRAAGPVAGTTTDAPIGASRDDAASSVPADTDDVWAWLAEVLGEPIAVEGRRVPLVEAGWDAAVVAEVVVAAEAELGAVLSDELVPELRTPSDVVDHICASVGGGDDPAPVSLQPVTGADEPLLFDWLTAPGAVAYRSGTGTPSPEQLHRLVWQGVVCQYLACRDDGVAVGLVSCFEPDHRNRFAHLGVLPSPDHVGSLALPRAMARFVDLLFEQFDLRKLYAEVPDGDGPGVATGLERLFRHEGRLTEHAYVDGGYVDVHVLALHREDWEAGRRRHGRPPDRAPDGAGSRHDGAPGAGGSRADGEADGGRSAGGGTADRPS